MVVRNAPPDIATAASTRGIRPEVRPRVVMPSQRYSVLAKARRYREEPDRLRVLTHEPLTVMVNGFHALHTVVSTGIGLICSCGRSRRGDECAHVLAVASRFCSPASRVPSGELTSEVRADTGSGDATELAAHRSQNVYWPSAARSDQEPGLRKGSR
jgi:hypothetical protein